MATEKQKQFVWDQAETIRGKNPNLYRRDNYGNQILNQHTVKLVNKVGK